MSKTGEYVGRCEVCGKPIYESQEYYSDSEGVTWHKACGDENGD